jgi:hypothetical protein
MSEMTEEEKKSKIEIIMRQTDYDYSKSEEQLLKYNNNIEGVIKEYMGIVSKEKKNTLTSNQQRYYMIRKEMDTQMKNYQDKVKSNN